MTDPIKPPIPRIEPETCKLFSLSAYRETVAFRQEMADFAAEGLRFNMREQGVSQAERAFRAACPHLKSDPDLAKGIVSYVYRRLRVRLRAVLKDPNYSQEVRDAAFELACTTFASLLKMLMAQFRAENRAEDVQAAKQRARP